MVVDSQLMSFFTAGSLIVIGIFAALFLDNLIKKIIGLAFLGDGVNLFIITMGYKPGGIVYIFLPDMTISNFAQTSAYSASICPGAYQHSYRCQYTGGDIGFGTDTKQETWLTQCI